MAKIILAETFTDLQRTKKKTRNLITIYFLIMYYTIPFDP